MKKGASKQLLVSVDSRETRGALVEDGRAAEFYVERPGQASLVGNIYKGRVENVLAGMKVVCLPGLSSSVDWFLAADASMGTAEVAFWNGMQSPELFVQNPMADLTVDDAIYKVRHVWDVYPLSLIHI